MDILAWLTDLGLERYAVAFRDADVSTDILPELTDADLEKLGLPLGPRKKLLKAIRELGRRESPSVESGHALSEAAEPKEAERPQLTVMFVDLVGSTALSGRLDPEDYRKLITSFQKAVSEAVRRFDGHVAKYLGDGILVYFGYPQAHEDDAERAIRTSLAALAAVHGLVPEPRQYDTQAAWKVSRLAQLLDAFTPQECANYFKNSGHDPI